MDLQAWKRRRLTPTWGGNTSESEPCVIIFHPPTVGWMAKWRELIMAAPSLDADRIVELSLGEGESSPARAWSDSLYSFKNDVIADLVIGVENLTMDGKSVDLSGAIQFIGDNEGLREEVFNAIMSEGTVDASAGKD